MTAISGPARRRSGRSTKWLTIGLFVLPALALYAVFVMLPVVQAMQYSLYKWNGLTPLTEFVGLQNYVAAFGNKAFTTSIGNNLLILVLSLFVQIPFSLAMAVLLNRRFPGRMVLRLLFFLPYVLSEAVTGIVFTLMLRPDSVVDTTLARIALEGLVQDWLGDSTLVMITLFVIISWKYFGFHMILLLAGLQGIPKELEDAALIDGADRRQAFRYVTLPLLGPTLRVSIFLSMIGALQLFDVVWVMTGGGPVNASSTMAIAMFKAGFRSNQFGYGSALAVILFLLCLVVALLYQRYVLRRDTEGAITAYSG
ncbi:MAG TPA: sugar ABC transporter permease [Candidatus Limnocylindrales bacterium]|nr:sugar ABC transporter permease [Candidatus Limnocylindrales bacterium]